MRSWKFLTTISNEYNHGQNIHTIKYPDHKSLQLIAQNDF